MWQRFDNSRVGDFLFLTILLYFLIDNKLKKPSPSQACFAHDVLVSDLMISLTPNLFQFIFSPSLAKNEE